MIINAYLLIYKDATLSGFFTSNHYIPDEYIVISHQIRADVLAILTKRYNMRVISTTGGLADCVNILGLGFQIRGPLSKERLRAIVIDGVEEFLTAINADVNIEKQEKIRKRWLLFFLDFYSYISSNDTN